MNLYVTKRDLSRAKITPSSPSLPEAFESGAFGGGFVFFVVQVDIQPRVVDFLVGTYSPVVIDRSVPFMLVIELFWPAVLSVELATRSLFVVGDFMVTGVVLVK